MHRTKLMCAAIAALAAMTACDKRDNNTVTGSNDYSSVAVTSDPTSFTVAEGDSAEFTPIATTEPDGVEIANGFANMTFDFADPGVAEINGSGFVQGDSVGTTTLTITYTDVDHDFATSSFTVPVTVTAPAP
jgi:hypothetical protein